MIIVAAPQLAVPQDAPHSDDEVCGAQTPEAVCDECHGRVASRCPHQGVAAADLTTTLPIPQNFAAHTADGRVVCTTCHDLRAQCTDGGATRYLNPASLRFGPYWPTVRFCAECHDTARYPRLNPHEQIAGGAVRHEACSFCHKNATDTDAIALSDGFQIAGNAMCFGCHPVTPHPGTMTLGGPDGTWTHLVAPSADVLARMRDTEAHTGVRLPFDAASGEITCATCHEPHAAGVISRPATVQADYRLRSPDPCTSCHDM